MSLPMTYSSDSQVNTLIPQRIAQSLEQHHHNRSLIFPNSASFIHPSPHRAACMPRLVNLSDLNLHSPSPHIVGTPFANDNTRFEYPFPDIPPVDMSASSRSPPPLSTTLMLMTPKGTSTSPANPKLKLKITTNPPIPPTLAAKKAKSHMRKWSLAATGQRRSSSGQSDSSASTTRTHASFSSNRSIPTPISPSRKSRR